MSNSYKKIFFTIGSIIAIAGYSFVVFAAAPNGGYNPGQILDPDCAPGDVDCVVKLQISGGGTPAGSDTQIQYNNAGSFGADSGLTFNQTTNTFTATNDWEIFRSEIKFSSNGGSDDLSTSSATSFTGTPLTIFLVLAFGNIQIVNYTNLVGGNFSQGDIITGSISGAQGTVAYDDGSGQLYVSITNSIQFASGDVIDNGNGVTADYDTSTTSDDIFFWFSSNGGTGGPTVITGSSQALNDGIDITFGSTTGHGAGDSWQWSYKTLKNTLLTNRIVGAGALSGAINGQYFKSGSGSSIIQSMNGFFQNGDDDRIFPLSYYEDLTGNNSDKERAYYGLSPFKNDPSEPLNFTVYTRKGLGPGPGTSDISKFSVSSLNGIRMESDKIVYIDSPLFQVAEQIFSWTGNTNSTGITIDDIAQTINFNNNYSFPFADGTAGQVLGTDGSGQLGWVTVSGGSVSPISIGTSGNTLYSSGLSGTGQGDTSTGNNIFLGINAGNSATNASFSNFLGINAGNSATNASNSNFFGPSAGDGATNASYSNFFGYQAGFGATNAIKSQFFGEFAGSGATDAWSSIFFGDSAGRDASAANRSNFFGSAAGWNATNAELSNFFGGAAGMDATNAANSNFFGYGAGISATDAAHSNFLGTYSGAAATNASFSNFLGINAGNSATNASFSNFLGSGAGYGATSASGSNFLGLSAGYGAANAYYSNFFGTSSGQNATNASNSIFIGKSAGYNDLVNNTGDSSNFSILIGPNTSTGNNGSGVGYSNSIALGGYATNTASNQFMIGSTTRTIDTTVWKGAASTTCTLTTGTGMACSSDERLKTNITDLTTDTLERLLNLKTVKYNWLQNPTSATQIGFLAQDLEQYFPELVATDNEGMKSVYYAQMTPILVEAIREMNLKITTINDMATPNTWRDSLIAWFGNIENGITDFFTKTSHTETLCVGTNGNETCITKDQLDQLLNNTAGGSITPAPAPSLDPVSPDSGNTTSESTGDTPVNETPSPDINSDTPTDTSSTGTDAPSDTATDTGSSL